MGSLTVKSQVWNLLLNYGLTSKPAVPLFWIPPGFDLNLKPWSCTSEAFQHIQTVELEVFIFFCLFVLKMFLKNRGCLTCIYFWNLISFLFCEENVAMITFRVSFLSSSSSPPGQLNYLGASHQLWHILVVVMFYWWHQTAVHIMHFRHSQSCPTRTSSS